MGDRSEGWRARGLEGLRLQGQEWRGKWRGPSACSSPHMGAQGRGKARREKKAWNPPFLTPSSSSSLTPHRPNPFHRHPPRRVHSRHRHHLPSYSAPSFPSRCHHGPRPSHHGPSCGTAPRSRGLQAPKRQPVTGSWHAAPVQTQHQQTTTKRISPAHHQPVVPRFHPPISHPYPSFLTAHFSPPPILLLSALRVRVREFPDNATQPVRCHRTYILSVLSFIPINIGATNVTLLSDDARFFVHEIPSHGCSANTS